MENLPSIKSISFFEKIKNKIKIFFGIYEKKEEREVINQIKENINKTNFKNKIKFEENLEKKKLLEIQKVLENGEITLELASELTKDLTSKEKSNLLELYKTQINQLEMSLENYKRKILAIKNI